MSNRWTRVPTRLVRSQLPGIVLVLATSAMAGCGTEIGGCGGSSPSHTAKAEDDVKAVVSGVNFVSVYKREAGKPRTYVDDSTEVLPSELEFEVVLSATYPEQSSNLHHWSILDWMIRPAYACSPPFVEPKFSSKISNADLSSDASMGPGLEAGSSLAPTLTIQSLNADESTDVVTDAPPAVPLDEFGSPEPKVATYSYLVTVSSVEGYRLRPQSDAEHRFTFSITLEDGSTFSHDSRKVRILAPT